MKRKARKLSSLRELKAKVAELEAAYSRLYSEKKESEKKVADLRAEIAHAIRESALHRRVAISLLRPLEDLTFKPLYLKLDDGRTTGAALETAKAVIQLARTVLRVGETTQGHEPDSTAG